MDVDGDPLAELGLEAAIMEAGVGINSTGLTGGHGNDVEDGEALTCVGLGTQLVLGVSSGVPAFENTKDGGTHSIFTEPGLELYTSIPLSLSSMAAE